MKNGNKLWNYASSKFSRSGFCCCFCGRVGGWYLWYISMCWQVLECSYSVTCLTPCGNEVRRACLRNWKNYFKHSPLGSFNMKEKPSESRMKEFCFSLAHVAQLFHWLTTRLCDKDPEISCWVLTECKICILFWSFKNSEQRLDGSVGKHNQILPVGFQLDKHGFNVSRPTPA